MIQTIIGVEGMSCSMCEAHVNDAIRRAFDVKSVKADRRKKNCVIISESELDEEGVRAAIIDIGYEPTSFSAAPYQKKGIFGR